MKKTKHKKVGSTYYNLSKSNSIYCNRAAVIPSDEEIVLMLGTEMRKENVVDVDTTVYLTLPSFLRLYDALKATLDRFKESGSL